MLHQFGGFGAKSMVLVEQIHSEAIGARIV
jgi:hypothetical protein